MLTKLKKAKTKKHKKTACAALNRERREKTRKMRKHVWHFSRFSRISRLKTKTLIYHFTAVSWHLRKWCDTTIDDEPYHMKGMNIIMKKTVCALFIFFIMLISACGMHDSASRRTAHSDFDNHQNTTHATSPEQVAPSVSLPDFSFEEVLLEFITDVVVARYMGSRPFGRGLIEFEFAVQERVLGNAPDTIFVYQAVHGPDIATFGVLSFNYDTTYLLPLAKTATPYSFMRDDGYVTILNLIIDLDTPSNSTMYNEPLSWHTERLDFDGNITRQEIISYVAEVTRHNPPARSFIRSEAIEDIVYESPYIWVIEIGEPHRLTSGTSDWTRTDIYHATTVQVLKGDIDIGYEFTMIFNADTVFPGELHIIATEPRDGRSGNYRFSSRNSLFRLDQKEEIMAIIAGTTAPPSNSAR